MHNFCFFCHFVPPWVAIFNLLLHGLFERLPRGCRPFLNEVVNRRHRDAFLGVRCCTPLHTAPLPCRTVLAYAVRRITQDVPLFATSSRGMLGAKAVCLPSTATAMACARFPRVHVISIHCARMRSSNAECGAYQQEQRRGR